MPIRATCQCGASFQAKDHLAGKRVRCPKCSEPISIPGPKTPARAQAARGQSAKPQMANNPLLDLLDEAGVEAASQVPLCPACQKPLKDGAVLCVECGFNLSTGEYLETLIEYDEYEDDDPSIDTSGMTASEQLMAKAERAISDTPETAQNQDFGDGADAYVVAFGAAAALLIGTVIVVTMMMIGGIVADALGGGLFISLAAGLVAYCVTLLWIIVLGFLDSPTKGSLLFIGFPVAKVIALVLNRVADPEKAGPFVALTFMIAYLTYVTYYAFSKNYRLLGSIHAGAGGVVIGIMGIAILVNMLSGGQ